MGSLYWQIDDCWPVASWSSMDYYKRWKAVHYIAKKAFEPVLISADIKDDSIDLYIVSDKLQNFHADLILTTYGFEGNEIYSKSFPVQYKK